MSATEPVTSSSPLYGTLVPLTRSLWELTPYGVQAVSYTHLAWGVDVSVNDDETVMSLQ